MFTLITVGHLRVRHETGARLGVLLLGLASTSIVLVAFVFTTLVDEPATAALLTVILVLGVGLDLGWKHRPRRAGPARHDSGDRRLTSHRSGAVGRDAGPSTGTPRQPPDGGWGPPTRVAPYRR